MAMSFCRSSDGAILVVSSSDGYCSTIHFHEGELGKPYDLSVTQVLERSSPNMGQNMDASGRATVVFTFLLSRVLDTRAMEALETDDW